MGQSRGKGLVQSLYKMTLKSHFTYSSISLPSFTQHFQVAAALLGCFQAALFKAADLCSYKLELALKQVLHQGINTFPPPKSSYVTGHQQHHQPQRLSRDLWDAEMGINYSQTSPR